LVFATFRCSSSPKPTRFAGLDFGFAGVCKLHYATPNAKAFGIRYVSLLLLSDPNPLRWASCRGNEGVCKIHYVTLNAYNVRYSLRFVGFMLRSQGNI